jgi:hypothetical protein
MQKTNQYGDELGSAADRTRRLEAEATAIAVWGDEGGQQVDGPGGDMPRSTPAQSTPDSPTLGPVMRALFPTQHQFDGLVLPWSWCRCCQRAFVRGTFRRHRIAPTARHPRARMVKECPYQDCWGQILRDSRPWASIRQAHTSYPEQPERHVIYPHE